MTATATIAPATTRRALSLAGGRVSGSPSRHQPRLCPICQRPMGHQEDACWRCGAPVRHEQFTHGPGPYAVHMRRSRHSGAFSAFVSRRRANRVDHDGSQAARVSHWHGAVDAAPSRAEDHAAGQQERAEANRRAELLKGELAAAIAPAGNASYRGLRHRLDEFGTELALARLRLCNVPTTSRISRVSRTR